MSDKKVGRKPKPKGERVKILQLYAKEKNHPAIIEKIAPVIERLEKKLDKEANGVQQHNNK